MPMRLVIVLLVWLAASCGAALAQVPRKLGDLYPPAVVITQDLSPEERAVVLPTLITLHLKNASALDVARAAAKQAKLRLVEPPPGVVPDRSGKTVTIDLDRQPLWWALAQAFEGRDDVFIRVHDETSLNYSVGSGTDKRTHWSVSGPFLLKAAPPRDAGRFELTIWVTAEPKLTILGAMPPTNVSVVDESGQPFDVEGGDFGLSQGAADFWTAFNVNFRRRPGASRIGQVKGVGRALVEVASDRRRVPAKVGAEVNVAGMKLRVRDLMVGKERGARLAPPYTIVFSVADVPAGEAERTLQLLRGARVDVWDDEHQPIIVDSRWPELKGGEVRLRLEGIAARPRDEVESAPAFLQINVPTKATIIDIPFEFNGIPLPVVP